MNIKERILIFQDGKTFWYAPDDICYFKGEGSYTQIVTADQTTITVSKNLKHVLGVLPQGCNQFFRVHKSWVVNVNHIKFMRNISAQKYMLHMNGGVDIPLGSPSVRTQLLSLFESAVSLSRVMAKSRKKDEKADGLNSQ